MAIWKYRIFVLITIFVIILDFVFFFHSRWFFFIFVLSFYITLVPIWLDYFLSSLRIDEINARFPEFVRNLAGAVKSGMPIPQAIQYVADTDYGALTPYIKKMANQLEWGIPVEKVLMFFSYRVRSPMIKRAIKTIIEGEKSGGQMDVVLMSITESLVQLREINEERKANIQRQVVQNYIIYGVFLVILIVLQNMLIPTLADMQNSGLSEVLTGAARETAGSFVIHVQIKTNSWHDFISSLSEWFLSMHGIFMMISIIQAFFSGLVLGKMATGKMMSGTKHSFILMTIGFIVIYLSQMISSK